MRFESLEEAQAYLDHWETRWADTRIHGTTKRQVAAMFAEERPSLLPLPVEPFRYYQYGERSVHLDGCVEVEAAYYSAPPGWIGTRVRGAMGRTARSPARSPKLASCCASICARNAAVSHQRRGPIPSKTPLRHTAVAVPRRPSRIADRRPLPRHVSAAGRTGGAPHSGRALAGQKVRRGCGRRCLRRRPRNRRLRLPFRSPLSGAGSPTAAELAAGRSSDPRTDALSRSDRTTKPQEQKE